MSGLSLVTRTGIVRLTCRPGCGVAAGSGQSVSDLLIAAVAEREQVTLLHYDSDYDLVAEITRQPMQWGVPRGTVP
jgi:predicted nucleic acid-binding protein